MKNDMSQTGNSYQYFQTNRKENSIEELLVERKEKITILMVSHYQDQVRRVADLAYELTDRQLRRVS